MQQELTDEGASYAFLLWTNASRTDRMSVSLVRTTEPNLQAPGDPVDMTMEGSDPGELYEGNQPGEASVYWVIPNVTICSTVALWFSADDMTRAQARREARRIAESLRPVG